MDDMNTIDCQKPSFIKRLVSKNLFMLSALVILMLIIFAATTENFFTWDNLPMVLTNMATNGTLAIGMTFCILTTGIDLSVGSVLGLAGVIAAIANKSGASPIVSILAGLLVGVLCGAVTGSLVSVFRIPAFIASLGMQSIASGVALTITGGTPISSALTELKFIGTTRLLYVPWGVRGDVGLIPLQWLIMLVCFIVAHFILQYTRTGRYMYTIGGNPEAARFSGINLKVYTAIPFVFSGFLAAIASLVMISRTSSADAIAGQGLELDAVAASIIGGTSMRGGEGSMIGTFVGALLMAMLKNGMVQMHLSTYPQNIILGVIIIVVVVIDTVNKSRK